MRDRRAFLLGGCLALCGTSYAAQGEADASDPQGHVAWVARVLERMETIKVGMTRERLMTVFTTEGGLSTPEQQTFVSRDCPYFKVTVFFEVPEASGAEPGGQVIRSISEPFLQFRVVD